MSKLVLYLSLILSLLSCEDKPVVKKGEFNQPNADFDLDGKTNQSELNDGENPYINNEIANNYLGDSKTSLHVRLKTHKEIREELGFLNLEDSIKFFNEKSFIIPSLFKDQVSKNTSKDIYFKNVLACMSSGQLNSLEVKYPKFELGDVDIISELSSLSQNLDTQFYIYDFNTLEDIYFFKNQQRESENYKSHRFSFDYSKLSKDFCILYDNPRTKIDGLVPVFKLHEDKLEKQFVVKRYSKGLALNQSLELGSYKKAGNIYYNPKNKFYSTYSIFEKKNSTQIGKEDLEPGMHVSIKRYISSKIKYRKQLVGTSGSDIRYNPRQRGAKLPTGCNHFHKPQVKDVFSFNDLKNIPVEDLDLEFANTKIRPKFLSGFYVEYSFEVTDEMLLNGKLDFEYLNETTKKYKFKSFYYSEGELLKPELSKFSYGRSRSCLKPFSIKSMYADFKDMNSIFFISY